MPPIISTPVHKKPDILLEMSNEYPLNHHKLLQTASNKYIAIIHKLLSNPYQIVHKDNRSLSLRYSYVIFVLYLIYS